MKTDTTNEVAPTPTNMTPEEINKRIATACGWKTDKRSLGWLDPQGCYSEMPNYHGDLNAMHEAVMSLLTVEKCTEWRRQLQWIVAPATKPSRVRGIVLMGEGEYHRWFNATAAQRAEAFLRTIGQWEEGK